MEEQHFTQKLSFIEKTGYSAADSAANFVFMTMIFFQTNFYTDVFGLSATAAAAILLWPRLWDAVVDPIVGVLADRTNTRWGKFRPWVLFTAVPWCVVMILAYTTPMGWSTGGADRLCGDHEHAADVHLFDEQHALCGAGGGDDGGHRRAGEIEFVSVRRGEHGAIHRGGIHAAAGGEVRRSSRASRQEARDARPRSRRLVDERYGWQMTMRIWAVVCLVLFLITFVTTRSGSSRRQPEHSSPKQDFADLIKNSPVDGHVLHDDGAFLHFVVPWRRALRLLPPLRGQRGHV